MTLLLVSCVNGSDDNSALPSLQLKYPPTALRLVVDNPEIQAASTTIAHAQGGTPTYTYSLLNGQGTVNPLTGVYTPASTFAGTAVIQATDSVGQTAFVSVLVYPSLVVTPQSSIKYVNEVLPLAATGGKAPYLFTLVIGAATLTSTSASTVNVTMPAVQTTILILVTDALGDKVTADITVISPLLALADADIIPANREMKIKISGGKIFNPLLSAPSAEYRMTLQQGLGTISRIDPNTWKYSPPFNPYQEERGAGKVKILVEDNNLQSVLVQFEVFIPPDVVVGSLHSCAVNNKTGAAKCWGDNLRGQLGEADPLKKNQSYWGDEPNEQSTVSENFLRVDLLSSNEITSQCGQLIDYTVGIDTICAIVSVGCGTPVRDVRCLGANDSADNNGLDGLNVLENDFNRWRHPILRSEGENSQLYRWSLADFYSVNYNPSPYFRRTTNVIPSQNSGMSEQRINSGYQLPMDDYSYLSPSGFVPDKIFMSKEGYYDPNLSMISTTGALRRTCNGFGSIRGGGGSVPQIPGGINYKNFSYYKHWVYDSRTCYVGTDDYGYCFGSNQYGITGRGDLGPLNSSYSIGGPSDTIATRVTTGINATIDKISAISTGAVSGCAVFDATSTKTVGCWGANYNGVLGTANGNFNFFQTGTAQFVQKNTTGNLTNAVKIVHTGAGSSTPTGARACASISDGSLWCWGANDANQLPGYFGDQSAAVKIDLGLNEQVVDFDLLGGSSCAITRNSVSSVKSLKCWGGSTGPNNERDSYAYPKPRPGAYAMATVNTFVTGSIDPTAIKMSIHGGCVIDGTSKYLKCWGDNRKSMFGIGNGMRGNKPLDMGTNLPVIDVGSAPARTIKKIVAGGENTCAILDNDRLKCWGTNEFGQLGLGRPTGVDGHAHIGDNDNEMGDNLPALTFPGELAHTVSTVAIGRDHICAATLSNNLFCWGDNTSGQLGINSAVGFFTTPQKVDITGLGTISGLALGFNHTCATFDLLGSRSLRCWGSHQYGQLGYGDLNYVSGIGLALHSDQIIGNQASDVAVKNLPAVDLGGVPLQSVSAGGLNTCVLFVNGKVRCYGHHRLGQVGIGSYDLSNSGYNDNMGNKLAEVGYKYLIDFGINSLTGAPHYALQVSVGVGYVCAVLDSNKLKCWGHNSMGQLGLENTQNKGVNNNEMGSGLSYVNLGPGLGVLSVSAGLAHSCAVLSNASVKCWGVNFSGQLGFGMDYSRGYTPFTMGTSLPYVDLVWP